jgi:hypothetical protein
MENLAITDEEWEELRQSPFDMEDFLKALKMFDSIRHIAGGSDFSAHVYADMQKLMKLAECVFTDGCRDSAGELFFEASCLNEQMGNLETWISRVRGALNTLEELRPSSLEALDDLAAG